jgi:hypothetical protein
MGKFVGKSPADASGFQRIEGFPILPQEPVSAPAKSQDSALESKRTTGVEPATFGLGSHWTGAL